MYISCQNWRVYTCLFVTILMKDNRHTVILTLFATTTHIPSCQSKQKIYILKPATNQHLFDPVYVHSLNFSAPWESRLQFAGVYACVSFPHRFSTLLSLCVCDRGELECTQHSSREETKEKISSLESMTTYQLSYCRWNKSFLNKC